MMLEGNFDVAANTVAEMPVLSTKSWLEQQSKIRMKAASFLMLESRDFGLKVSLNKLYLYFVKLVILVKEQLLTLSLQHCILGFVFIKTHQLVTSEKACGQSTNRLRW